MTDSAYLNRPVRTEAKACTELAAPAPTAGYRIEPTAEDAAIASRLARRMTKWVMRENLARRLSGREQIGTRQFVAALRRATEDHMEFGPFPDAAQSRGIL